jgi:hypothetical protein
MKFIKFLILILSLSLISCGKKAPPLPIKESIPKEPSLQIKATQGGFELLITLPTHTQGGYLLTKIKKLIIEKKEWSLDRAKAEKKIYKIKLKPSLHPAATTIVYNDYKVKNRYCYSYRVKVEKDFLVKTPFTAPVSVCWHNPPSFPENFRIKQVQKNVILLSWDRPTKDIYGLKLKEGVFYRIEKLFQGKKKVIEVKGNEFWDKITSSKKVCYRIRAVLDFKGTLIPGPKTPQICTKD